MDNELFLEPTKYYQHGLKDLHQQNIDSYFEDLTKKSGVSPDENKVTCQKYYAKEKELASAKKKLGSTKGWSTFLLVIGIILAVAIIGIFLLILRKKKFKTKIQELEQKVNKLQGEADALKSEANAQMAPLNALFHDRMSFELFSKSAPIFTFNDHLTSEFMNRAINQFSYKEDDSKCNSTLVVQSGYLNKEPFIVRQYLNMHMVPEIYTGTLLITYTRTVSDGNGGTRTVTVTQTLVAHVTKPKPAYSVCAETILLSENAPKLSFTRNPAGMSGMSEKDIDKHVAKVEKEEQKKAQKAVKKGQTYTKMSNTKFEAFFNSEGRDNEVEYRMMFTPLAQTNLCYHYVQTEPYKDDITYVKQKCVNSIYSAHSPSLDYSGGVYNYVSFDYEVIKNNFSKYNMDLFTGMYYDFLPLLNIPIFLQNSSAPYKGPMTYKRGICTYEAECAANKIEDTDSLVDPDSDTEAILKTRLVSSTAKEEKIEIIAHTFEAVDDIELVPTMGGDGRLHPVPVHYYRYEPLEQVNEFTITKNDSSNSDNNKSIIKYRGLCLTALALANQNKKKKGD